MTVLNVCGQTIGDERLFVIGGPCVIENEEATFKAAHYIKLVCRELNVPCIFKSSYDKANRTSIGSFRGLGLEKGLSILGRIRDEVKIPVLTDVHSVREAEHAARFVDVLQIPALLSRQTDLLIAAAKTGKVINLKKGQFLAPWDMQHVIEKVLQSGNDKLLITERGSSFGYNNLVVDMRSIPMLARSGYPVVYDATHSVQLPGGQGDRSGGQREYIEPLACAAVAAGAHGVFLEVHESPDLALCDGPNSLELTHIRALIDKLLKIHEAVKLNNKIR